MAKRKSVSKIPAAARRRIIQRQAEKQSTPVYKDGVIEWKGLDISVKEAREFSQQLSRTPVSRGRFPSEADLIIDTIFTGQTPDFETAIIDPNKQAKLERWRDNYLTALNSVSAIATTAKSQDRYDELYWKIAELPLEIFAKAMYERGDELSVIFEYDDAKMVKWSQRISRIWQKYVD